MATFNTDVYNNKNAPGPGIAKATVNMHATTGTLSTALATNDVINVGLLPAGAVVTGAIIKAQSQLDSSTGLLWDLGVTGSATLFMASIATVGRASGVTSASTIATAGGLYKAAAEIAVILTVHTQATTAVAGVMEVVISYFVEGVAS